MDDLLPLFPTLLPAVPLLLKNTLPEVCAVYFALTETGRVLYIGATRDLRRRWASPHHRLHQLQTMECSTLAYYVCPVAVLDELEEAMIKHFTPPLNGPWRGPNAPQQDPSAYAVLRILKETLYTLKLIAAVKRESIIALITRLAAEERARLVIPEPEREAETERQTP